MTDNLIVPAAVKLAAKRAFVRTVSQAYAATLSAGVSVSVILLVVRGQADLLETAVTAGMALVTPLIAGLVAYLNVSSQGIPVEYSDAALVKLGSLGDDAQANVIDGVISRVSRT